MLSSQLRQAIPDCKVQVHCYKSFNVPNFSVWYGRYDHTFSVSVYGNCDEGTFPEILATCKSKLLESKRDAIAYNGFELSTCGQVFNRSSDLFDGIPLTADEEPLLIAMESGDYLAWQVYTDWLEESGHTMQALYIRHYINLHLRRLQSNT